MVLLRKFFARTWADQALLLRALNLVVLVRLGLWVLPYRRVHRLMDRPVSPLTDGPPTLHEELIRQRRIVGAVEAISRRLLGSKPCLTQALVAQRLLREVGIDTTLRIGVAKEGRELLAHAWLDRNGRVVIGGRTSPQQYTALAPMSPEVS